MSRKRMNRSVNRLVMLRNSRVLMISMLLRLQVVVKPLLDCAEIAHRNLRKEQKEPDTTQEPKELSKL